MQLITDYNYYFIHFDWSPEEVSEFVYFTNWAYWSWNIYNVLVLLGYWIHFTYGWQAPAPSSNFFQLWKWVNVWFYIAAVSSILSTLVYWISLFFFVNQDSLNFYNFSYHLSPIILLALDLYYSRLIIERRHWVIS